MGALREVEVSGVVDHAEVGARDVLEQVGEEAGVGADGEVHLDGDAPIRLRGVIGGAADVAGDTVDSGLRDGLAKGAAHAVGPDAEQGAIEDLGEVDVAAKVLELGFAGGVVEVGEAADVGGEAGGLEAGVRGALGEGAGGVLWCVGREVLGEAEPLDAVVVAKGGDVDYLLGGAVLEDFGDEGELHVLPGEWRGY